MLVIDGSQGEGGGQVLRTCLSLSALTGRRFRIDRIRGNRSRPGLRPQHLTAVRAVAAICDAEVTGDEIDSTTITFWPGSSPHAGDYAFDVTDASNTGRSAGAVTLIMQAILWPLLFAGASSHVTIRGGTFVPFSPPYHYLAEVSGPAWERLGATFTTELERWGWMQDGGGELQTTIDSVDGLAGIRFDSVPERSVGGLAAVTNLPSHIPHRMARRAHNLLNDAGLTPSIQPLRERGDGPGAGIVLWTAQAGFSALGRKGLPADKVAEAAVAELLAFVDNGAAVDRFLADQLLLPMALAHGKSSFTTDHLTAHTQTNASLLRRWLNVSISIQGSMGKLSRIEVNGVGFQTY